MKDKEKIISIIKDDISVIELRLRLLSRVLPEILKKDDDGRLELMNLVTSIQLLSRKIDLAIYVYEHKERR